MAVKTIPTTLDLGKLQECSAGILPAVRWASRPPLLPANPCAVSQPLLLAEICPPGEELHKVASLRLIA